MGTNNAQSFNERHNSAGKLLVTDKRRSLECAEVEMVATLKINKPVSIALLSLSLPIPLSCLASLSLVSLLSLSRPRVPARPCAHLRVPARPWAQGLCAIDRGLCALTTAPMNTTTGRSGHS